MSTEKTFNEEIVRIASEALESGELEELMRKRMLEAFSKAFEESMRWGDVHKAINKRFEEVLVPFIESYDMSQYVVKLDAVLQQLIEESAVADNRKILRNFSSIMKEPVEGDEITLQEIFSEYCTHVAENIDTSNLDVTSDYGEPSYEPVDAVAEIVMDEKPCGFISNFDHATLYLRLDESERQQDDLCFSVKLMRWKGGGQKDWDIMFYPRFTMSSLATMSDFECFLMALDRGQVKLEDGLFDGALRRLEDSVTPDATPEPTFS